MELKSGKITLKYSDYSKADGIAVVLSWNCSNVNQDALNCIINERLCDQKGLAETALCYGIGLGIQEALSNNPATIGKFQVNDISFNATGKMFSVSYKTKGSVSVLTRSLKEALKVLVPRKYVSVTSSLMRAVGQSINSEGKAYIEDKVTDELKQGVHVFVAGKMNVMGKNKKGEKFNKLKKAMESISAKFPVLSATKGKKAAHQSAEIESCSKYADESKLTKLTVSGINLIYSYYYITNRLKITPEVTNGGLLLYQVSPGKIAILKDKEKIKLYVDSKYSKLKDNLTKGTCYFATLSGLINAHALSKAESTGVTAASISSAIHSVFP